MIHGRLSVWTVENPEQSFQTPEPIPDCLGCDTGGGPNADGSARIFIVQAMTLDIAIELYPGTELCTAFFPAGEVLLETGPAVDRFG
jgi:hypothetical protein